MENNEFSENFNEKEFTLKEKEGKKSNIKFYIIGIIIISLPLIAAIAVIIYHSLNPKNDTKYLGKINCVYNIKSISTKEKLFGDKFEKKSKFDLYIDNKKVDFTKEYFFDKIGEHSIQISLNEKINMDFMFTDIKSLISVDMTNDNDNSKKNKIISMESTFENCINLKNFRDSHFFEDSSVQSMKKAFYNTGLDYINYKILFDKKLNK